MTGESGLLGIEISIIERSPWVDGDITNIEEMRTEFKKWRPDTVLHLAAATKPPWHEHNPAIGINNNIIGTSNIALLCFEYGVRLVYTSTDYNYVGPGPHKEDEPQKSPGNFYLSKLGGECAVAMIPNSLILRLSFGPRPYPWDKVYEGQTNSKLYVDQMAPLVLKAAKSEACGIMNLGGESRTLEEYARETKPDIETIPKPDWVPADTSLDLTKMHEWN